MSSVLNEDFKNAIPPLYKALEKLQVQVSETKKMINNLSVLSGDEPPFTDIEVSNIGTSNISFDQFFGKPFASAAKEFLKRKGKAATAEEILEALTKGGFQFPEEWDTKFYLRSVAMSLGKNTGVFVPIDNGSFKAFGIWEFYPEMKKKKAKAQKDKSKGDVVIDEDVVDSVVED